MTNQLTCRMKCQATIQLAFRWLWGFIITHCTTKNKHSPVSLTQEFGHSGNLRKTRPAFGARMCPRFSADMLKVRKLDKEDTNGSKGEIVSSPSIYMKKLFLRGTTRSSALAETRGPSQRLLSSTATQTTEELLVYSLLLYRTFIHFLPHY